jgi:hypothetical protein
MKFEEILPKLREGIGAKLTDHPFPWVYMALENGELAWYGFGEDPTRAIPSTLNNSELLSDKWVLVTVEEQLKLQPKRTFNCPQRSRFDSEALKDYWRHVDGELTCSYCGSLNPDTFMQGLEEGKYTLTPTDKGYKVYVDGAGLSHDKFYFQHLSETQMLRFIELYNSKALKLGYPGHFYTLPYFIKSA